MRDTLTQATAVYDHDNHHYVASLIIANTHPGDAHKALYALGIDTVQPTWGASGDSTVRIPLPHTVIQEVAQAAAEGLARAIGHVLPTVKYERGESA